MVALVGIEPNDLLGMNQVSFPCSIAQYVKQPPALIDRAIGRASLCAAIAQYLQRGKGDLEEAKWCPALARSFRLGQPGCGSGLPTRSTRSTLFRVAVPLTLFSRRKIRYRQRVPCLAGYWTGHPSRSLQSATTTLSRPLMLAGAPRV